MARSLDTVLEGLRAAAESTRLRLMRPNQLIKTPTEPGFLKSKPLTPKHKRKNFRAFIH
jgi:hypothetical protein